MKVSENNIQLEGHSAVIEIIGEADVRIAVLPAQPTFP